MSGSAPGLSSHELSFFIETLGCPKNKVDSRKMRVALLQAGFREAKNAKQSNLHLINSCSFIREAQEETVETVFDALAVKQSAAKNFKKVGLIGCFAERFSSAVKDEIPEIDFTVGTGKFHLIPQLLAEQFEIQLKPHDAIARYAVRNDEELSYTYFRIASGCSRSCSFCIIPKIRGPLDKYDLNNLEQQWQHELQLRELPPREVILVSQDSISQGVDELEKIVEYLSRKDEIRWIRLQYLFPDVRVLKLLELWKRYPKLTSYLDIPFQHVAPSVLKRMNRPDNTALFGDIMAKAREIRPSLEVRSSFIIGYPAETQNEYEQLKEFIEGHRVDKLALFRYSHEENTPAYVLHDDVDEAVKIERINELRDFHLRSRQDYRRSLEGKSELMIIDRVNQREIVARREQDSPDIDEVVFIDAPVQKGGFKAGQKDSSLKVGDFVEVTMQTAMEYDFIGELGEISSG